jgi:hypothetical protein
MALIRFLTRVRTLTPSPIKLLSVGSWMLVSTTLVSTRILRPWMIWFSCAIATTLW